MSPHRADRPGPWAAALLGQVLAVLLLALVSPNRYAWMLDDPGQTLPVDDASLLKAVLLLCTLAAPSLFVAWLTAKTRRAWLRRLGLAVLLLSALVAAGRGWQWVLEGQVRA